MLSSRLNAFVIPTSQTRPIAARATSLPTISTESPLASTIPAAANWAASFASGRSESEVVSSPATKRSAQPARIPSSSELGVDRADGDGEPHARHEAGEDADAAEESASRSRASAPPVGSATSRSPRWERRRRPDDESRDGQGREP